MTYIGDYLTIDKADPTCEVTPYDVSYDGNAHTATGSWIGVMSEELDGLDLSETTHLDAGNYTDPWTFTDVTGNYNDSNGTVNDKIALLAITIAADAKTKLFGQVDPALTYQITAGTLLSGVSFSGQLSRQPGEHIGTYAILQGTVSLPNYYEITYVGADFTITGEWMVLPLIFR